MVKKKMLLGLMLISIIIAIGILFFIPFSSSYLINVNLVNEDGINLFFAKGLSFIMLICLILYSIYVLFKLYSIMEEQPILSSIMAVSLIVVDILCSYFCYLVNTNLH